MRPSRWSLAAELAAGAASALLALLTLTWRDWIEVVFGVDPDHRNGDVEWVIVIVLAVSAVGMFVRAQYEWKLIYRGAISRG